MAEVARRKRTDPLADLVPMLTEFGGHKRMVAQVEKRIGTLKKSLMGMLERHGVADDKGSLWIEFEEPIAGYDAIKRERRAKVYLDEDKATRILKAAGVYEDCIDVDVTIPADQFDVVIQALKTAGLYDQVVTVTERLSDDKIMQLFFADKDEPEPRITEDDIDAMFTEDVTWAFCPQTSG